MSTTTLVAAEQKTRDLARKSVEIDLLEPNPLNPNKMGAREFDLLVDNLERMGFTDPILARPLPEGRYRIVGGHHRWEAARYLGFTKVPVTVVDDESFTVLEEDMQLLRHNTIRGRLDPQKFIALYAKYAGQYADDVLQEMMGFADEAELQRLIKQTAQALPKELKKKFAEAAKEIKTIDGLAKLLNTLFTKYGDTLPYGYMVVDYGGQQSLWLRVDKQTMDALEVVADVCVEHRRTMDDVIGGVVKSIARGDLKDLVAELIKGSPEVELPDGLQVAPTKDNVAKVTALA